MRHRAARVPQGPIDRPPVSIAGPQQLSAPVLYASSIRTLTSHIILSKPTAFSAVLAQVPCPLQQPQSALLPRMCSRAHSLTVMQSRYPTHDLTVLPKRGVMSWLVHAPRPTGDPRTPSDPITTTNESQHERLASRPDIQTISWAATRLGIRREHGVSPRGRGQTSQASFRSGGSMEGLLVPRFERDVHGSRDANRLDATTESPDPFPPTSELEQ